MTPTLLDKGAMSDGIFHNRPELWMSILINSSQRFAIWFNVGICGAILYLVFSSDLAFGWNTTLQFDDVEFHRIVNLISLPWQNMFPSAAPSFELVEISRYYRLDGITSQLGNNTSQRAQQLGQWWQFLLASVVVYGLIPRIIVSFITKWKLNKQVLSCVMSEVDVLLLLNRMRQPNITMQTTLSDPKVSEAVNTRALTDPSLLAKVDSAVIYWSNVQLSQQNLDQLGIQAKVTLQAGGEFDHSDEKVLLDNLRHRRPSSILVAVKGWEAPMLEFSDFVEELRLHCVDTVPIIVLLVPLPDTTLSDANIGSWVSLLSNIHDDHLFIKAIE